MTGFENYRREAQQIEHEIVRKGIALNIDWNDAASMHRLACDALDFKGSSLNVAALDPLQRSRIELYGLMQLMLAVMRESADQDIYTEGGPVWKAVGAALWKEFSARQSIK